MSWLLSLSENYLETLFISKVAGVKVRKLLPKIETFNKSVGELAWESVRLSQLCYSMIIS